LLGGGTPGARGGTPGMNIQGGINTIHGNVNGNMNTGHMDGGDMNQNIGRDQNGFQQNTHGLDIGKLLQTLLGSFTQSKSFNGQMQFTNKQTGQPATCEDLKSFLQQEINNQGLPYGNYQINGNVNTGTMIGGSQNIYVQQQQWNGYPAYDLNGMQQRNYNYYG